MSDLNDYAFAPVCSLDPDEPTFEPTAEELAGPPLEVLDALDDVQELQQELDERGLSVSFDQGSLGSLQVTLRDASGAVVKQYGPHEALESLSGETRLEELAP